MEKFFASCPRGLEALLAQDLAAAGVSELKTIAGGVHSSADWPVCYRANLESRIATRVLWRVAHGAYGSEDDIYRLALGAGLAAVVRRRPHDTRLCHRASSPLKSLEFITLRVKDAVCDRFRDDLRAPPERRHAQSRRAHASVPHRARGDALPRHLGRAALSRGHKIAKIEAPLKENLAAGILRLAGWQPGTPLLDPMCGSGTFLIEAAQMSLGDAPGLGRDAGEFGLRAAGEFRRRACGGACAAEAAQRRLEASPLPIWGSDISADAVRARARRTSPMPASTTW